MKTGLEGLEASQDVCLLGKPAENCAENSVPVVTTGSITEECDFPLEWKHSLWGLNLKM